VPSFVKVPRNESVIREFGPYPALLSMGERTTKLQDLACRNGLSRFEVGTQATLLALVQLADARPVHFFDVGAHIGIYSLLIATVYPADAVHVTAFEPTPRTSRIARSLAAANQLPIRIERAAVSDEDGSADLYISPWDTSNSLLAGFRPAQKTVTVPLVSLDSYCRQRGVQPSVMKIDVETLESKVLRGALQTIEQARTSVVCEMLRHADPAATAGVLGELVARGYHLHRWLRETGWQECTADDIVNQVPHDGKDWLFTPAALDDRFHESVKRWLAAMAECTSDTTVQVDRDRSTLPPARYELTEDGDGSLVARVRQRVAGAARA
jgi:FkbM family methyltransferase